MARVLTYLTFNGNCREAMTFYHECLGGNLFLQEIGESPMAADMPEEMHKNILHSFLELKNSEFMASDSMDPAQYNLGNAHGMTLDCESEDEIKEYFAALSAGGEATMPLEETFWAKQFGMLTDKFGICWMLNLAKEDQS